MFLAAENNLKQSPYKYIVSLHLAMQICSPDDACITIIIVLNLKSTSCNAIGLYGATNHRLTKKTIHKFRLALPNKISPDKGTYFARQDQPEIISFIS